MIKVVLVLLYIWSGQVKLEQIPTASQDACEALGQAKIEKLVEDPRFDGGLFAGCIPLKVQEAHK